MPMGGLGDFIFYGFFFCVVLAFIFFMRVARGSGRPRSIMVACQNGDFDEVRALLREARWLARSVDDNGLTPLHIAALAGFGDIVFQLLRYKADVNAENRAGMTPLHAAAMGGHSDVAEILVVHGAEVNRRDRLGNTPLYFAAWDGNLDVVNLLIAHGAELDAETVHQDTTLDRARRRGHHDVAQFLESRGAQGSQRWRESPVASAEAAPAEGRPVRAEGRKSV
ncbi:MAG: ankyrin repeat domain-containing protein [Planctomycetota bacterium]